MILAFAFTFFAFAVTSAEGVTRVLSTPAWAIVPVQLAINRLNARAGTEVPWRSVAAHAG